MRRCRICSRSLFRPNDVPIRGSVRERSESHDWLFKRELANDDRAIAPQVAHDAHDVERQASLSHRQQRIAIERLDADNRDSVDREADVWEVADEAQANAVPTHARVDGFVNFDLRALFEAASKKQRNREQNGHQQGRQTRRGRW